MTLDEITEVDKGLLAARYEAAITEEFGHTDILIQSERCVTNIRGRTSLFS
jgi:hypothetical protein